VDAGLYSPGGLRAADGLQPGPPLGIRAPAPASPQVQIEAVRARLSGYSQEDPPGMALREILIWPDPRLKQKSKPVDRVDDAVRKLCDDLAETMYESHGVGLAAPQVDAHVDVIAMDTEQKSSTDEAGNEVEAKKPGAGLFWLINPKLILAEGEFTYTEGCLSIPDEFEDVTRFAHIIVEFMGRDGKLHRREGDQDLLAVCVQHEMDHLEGKLFVDHLSALKRELIRRRMKKLKADRQSELKGEATAL
jgi:peptide deformylase